MIVALAVDLRAGLDEHAHDRQVGALGGEVQRIRVVAVVADPHVGAALQ